MQQEGVKLTFEADASDVDKKVDKALRPRTVDVDVGNPPQPVEVPVKTPQPVEVPVKPVEVPGSTQEIVAPKVKPDQKGIAKALDALHGLREKSNRILASIGVFGMYAGMATAAVSAIMRVKVALDDLFSAQKRVQANLFRGGIAQDTDNLLSKQGKINEYLKEELDLIRKANELRAAKVSATEGVADSSRRYAREAQLAGIDNPREREALEARFAEEDAARERARAARDREAKRKTLDDEASAYSGKADGANETAKEVAEQIAKQEALVKAMESSAKRRNSSWHGLDSPIEVQKKVDDDPEVKAARDKLAALKKMKDDLEKTAKEMRAEADHRLKLIEAMGGEAEAPDAAAVRKARRDAQSRRDAQDDADFRSERARAAEKEDERRRYATSDDRGKQSILEDREREAKERMAEAEAEYAAELAKDVDSRSDERLSRLRREIAEAQGDSYSAREARESLDREIYDKAKDRSDDEISRLNDAAGPGQNNRLRAMGLGDGTTAAMNTMGKEVAKITDILRATLEAIKANGTTATYGE